MIFDVHNETEISEDGIIWWDALEQIETSTVVELARMVKDGEVEEFNGFEINSIEVIDDNELLVEVLLPFCVTFQYRLIEQSVAESRKSTHLLGDGNA